MIRARRRDAVRRLRDPLHRRFISWTYHNVMALVFDFKVHDVDCDFRLIKRHVFERVALTQNSGTIALELMSKVQYAGYRTVEVPVNHYHRAYGVSQFFRIGRLLRVCVSLGKLWWWLRVQKGAGTAELRRITGPSRGAALGRNGAYCVLTMRVTPRSAAQASSP